MNSPLNETLLYARYAEILTLCVRAAIDLDVVSRYGDGPPLSASDLADRMQLDPNAGRSFFNVLWSLGILDLEDGHYKLSSDAPGYLSRDRERTLAPYLALGSAGDATLQDFVSFLKAPKGASRLYAVRDELCVMDDDGGSVEVALGLASRAARFTPLLARLIANHSVSERCTVVDAGAGSPYLAQALQALKPNWKIILTDRANAIPALRRMAAARDFSLTGQVEVVDWNFFDSASPTAPRQADIVCASNVFHDWSPEQIRAIAASFVRCVKPRGKLIVHEGILPSDRTSELRSQWMAAYGLALNRFTAGQGSCYTAAEYDSLFRPLGIKRSLPPVETVDGCSALIYDLDS